MKRLGFVLACACLLTIEARSQEGSSASTEKCPLDRVIWNDTKSNRVFSAKRVTGYQVYVCGNKLEKTNTGDDCFSNPTTTLYIEGRMGRQRVYAIHHSITATLPCCYWESKLASNTALRQELKRLKPVEATIEIDLKDPQYTISDSGDEWGPLKGPLKGGEFVPAECRR